MDWKAAIDRHRLALAAIVRVLLAMARPDGPAPEGREGAEEILAGEDAAPGLPAPASPPVLHQMPEPAANLLPLSTPTQPSPDQDPPPTLPRHLHRAVLSLLRPAEAAARRLAIALARDMAVPPPPPRFAWSPSPVNGGGSGPCRRHRQSSPAKRGRGTAEGGGGGAGPGTGTAGGGGGGAVPTTGTAGSAPPARKPSLPLLDPLRGPRHRRRAGSAGVPRISVPGIGTLFAVAPRRKPAQDDPVSAARLHLRLRALAATLDDLPAAALRFARWQARRDAAAARARSDRNSASTAVMKTRRRAARLWPLRPGRPPGWRRRRRAHPVHALLDEAHWLALWALRRADTS